MVRSSTKVLRSKFQARRYLGLELAGAKNQKTVLAALEYYPRESKIFLLDIFEGIGGLEGQSGDEALLQLIRECSLNLGALGVNVPLDLPPCIPCTRKTCPLPEKCSVPTVKWMREQTKKAQRKFGSTRGKRADPLLPSVKEFTPYTQRPIELWLKYHVIPSLELRHTFEIDETLGGNRAPLTARMNFLKRHLKKVAIVETLPKLTLHVLAKNYHIPQRLIRSYRHLQKGAYARSEILDLLSKKMELFIYDRDLRKISQNLQSFDALLCAFTALLSDQKKCETAPKGFPSSGWVTYPTLT